MTYFCVQELESVFMCGELSFWGVDPLHACFVAFSKSFQPLAMLACLRNNLGLLGINI